MKDDTLLDLAKSNLSSAKLLYRFKDDDEIRLNTVGYLLQQAIELALKHHLETSGIEYPKTHDIDSLLALCNEDEFPEIVPWAESITTMESKTRYIKNYRLTLRKVDQIMQLADQLMVQIENMHAKDSEDSQES
ncbi:MAG: HEPN domain-containing protein [Selenomonadaceae bacterium]|nr:HEPN domain-containing protein [Selenomonadaceae bacterium]MBQ1914316.1 HEPN domain-containing protein [Selenomonadaceae bacterium]